MFNFLILLCTQLSAQEPLVRNRETNPNYEEGDWISYSVARFVTSIAVGQQYIYFGTKQSGISRYDQFQNRWDFPWTTSNGLADNEVWVVAYDFDTGFLWCATHTAISYYHPTAHRWRNFFKDEFGLPIFDEIKSIGIGSDRIWFETSAGRSFETNKYGGIILLANTSFDNSQPDKSIKWYGEKAQEKQKYPQFFMSDGFLFNPQGIVEDSHFRQAKVVAAVEDNWGNLWIGTWGLGAGRGDVQTQRLEMLSFGLCNPTVNAMSFYDDVLWIAGAKSYGSNHGITAWDLRGDVWRHFDQRDIIDLHSDRIYSITLDGDNLWFSTTHGLSRYATKKGRWKTLDSFSGLSDNQVFDAVVDDSSIWVATANGIDRILKKSLSKKDSLVVEHINPGHLRTIEVYDLELMENLLWAATNRGIYVYDTHKKEGGFSDEIGGPTNEVVTSISRYENEIWFGTLSGIEIYDIGKREWLGVPKARTSLKAPINKILASKEAVWAATNRGVMKFNRKNKTWRTFSTVDGLIDNRVNALLLDGDYIWIGTNRGLTQ
ncbi:MAG: two-component regulator propeller domain-containing protein, partial [bacterium]